MKCEWTFVIGVTYGAYSGPGGDGSGYGDGDGAGDGDGWGEGAGTGDGYSGAGNGNGNGDSDWDDGQIIPRGGVLDETEMGDFYRRRLR